MKIRLPKDIPLFVRSASDIHTFLRRILQREPMPHRNREHLWTVSLNQIKQVLHIELVSLGTVNKVMAEPMEVFSTPLQKRAVSLILVHNHPSGQLFPSLEDKMVTQQLAKCGKMLKLPLLDHVIISEEGYYSFAENGLLEERKWPQELRQSLPTASFRRRKV